VHLGLAHSRARPARPSGPATWASGPPRRGRGGARLRRRWWRLGRIPAAPDNVVGWWTHFGAAGRKSSPEEQAQRRGVIGRRGTEVGAASQGGGRRLGVRGGCTLRRSAQVVVKTVGERPERAVRGSSAVAGMVAQWGRKVEEEERVLHGGGVGALYSG
jgi:hypothetical protein